MNKANKNRPQFTEIDPAEFDVSVFALDEATRSVLHQRLKDFGFRTLSIEQGDVTTAAKKYRKNQSPKLLIVDISNSDLPLSEIQELANVCPPTVRVIVIGTIDTVGLYRSLINQGVSDYLVKPLSEGLLKGVLRRLFVPDEALNSTSTTGKSIGVLGASGGIGATSLTGAVGDILSTEFHRKIMLIDLNLQNGDLGLLFDKSGGKGLSELLLSPERVDSVFLERASISLGSRLDLLNADDDWNSELSVTPLAVKNLLVQLRQHYHFTMFDVMSQPTRCSLEILASTDIRILLLSPSLASLRNTKKILDHLSANKSNASTLVVLSHSRPTTSPTLSIEKVEKYIGRSIDYQLSFDGKNISKAMTLGGPLSQHKGKVAVEMRTLAKNLLGQNDVQKAVSIWKKFIVRKRDVWSENT